MFPYYIYTNIQLTVKVERCDVVVNVLTSVVLNPQKEYIIGICCVSAEYALL